MVGYGVSPKNATTNQWGDQAISTERNPGKVALALEGNLLIGRQKWQLAALENALLEYRVRKRSIPRYINIQ